MNVYDFVQKVYLPLGLLACLGAFLLRFVVEADVRDTVLAVLIGAVVVGVPLLGMVARRS